MYLMFCMNASTANLNFFIIENVYRVFNIWFGFSSIEPSLKCKFLHVSFHRANYYYFSLFHPLYLWSYNCTFNIIVFCLNSLNILLLTCTFSIVVFCLSSSFISEYSSLNPRVWYYCLLTASTVTLSLNILVLTSNN